MSYRARIIPDLSGGDYRLYIMRDLEKIGQTGRIVEVANGFTWIKHEEGDAWFVGDGIGRAGQLIQAIMDQGWENNYRPTGFTDIRNETAALREHLSDMKRIAFHQLKING